MNQTLIFKTNKTCRLLEGVCIKIITDLSREIQDINFESTSQCVVKDKKREFYICRGSQKSWKKNRYGDKLFDMEREGKEGWVGVVHSEWSGI